MANQFCTNCGAKTAPESLFCTACGMKIEPLLLNTASPEAPPKVPEAAGVPALPAVTQGSTPKIPVSPPSMPREAPSVNVQNVMPDAGDFFGNTAFAAAAAGEMSFTQSMPAAGNGIPGMGPFKYLLSGIGLIFKGFKEVFVNKKRSIPVLVISLIWFLLMLLPVLGVNSSAQNWLSFLTFAQGGTGGGLLSVVGGFIGKGIFAYFLTSLLLPLSGGKPFAGLGGGLKTLFGSFGFRDKKAFALLLTGIGLALICYNFLTGNASLQNSMVGIAAFLVSLRALANNGGFLRGFFMSFLKKSTKAAVPASSNATCIMAGWTWGFALGVLLSGTGISNIGYLAGIIIVIIAVILRIIFGRRADLQKAV